MRALAPGAAFASSWRMFASRPVVMLSLGAALFISLLAVCCGFGVFAAPWFMCELFAIQIGSGDGESPRRSSAWIAAGLVQLSAVLVLGLLALLAALALGPDVLLGALSQVGAPRGERLVSVATSTLGAGACALALTVHFQYAPALLIERGGSLFGALLASAQLVSAGGFVRTWLTSFVAHALPWASITLTLGALLAAGGTRAPTLAIMLLALPLLAATSALSQGMIIASYLALREHESRLLQLRLSWAHGIMLWLLVGLFALTPVLLFVGLLEPAPLARGELDRSAAILLEAAPSDEARELYLPESALRLVLERDRLQVVASDGGGAGALPLAGSSARRPIARVRVARSERGRSPETVTGARFAIEVRLASGVSHVTAIDESGVRLDDSLEHRFAQLLPKPAVYAFALAWAWLVAWSARALPRLAARGREGRTAAFGRALTLALLSLAPPALLCAALAAWALLR